jgi:hypothetical protein
MTNTVDLDGNNRIIATIVDRGCYEYNYVVTTCAVYGINGALITNGEAADNTKGTYFSTRIRPNTALTNQFSITNSGTTNLIISGAGMPG